MQYGYRLGIWQYPLGSSVERILATQTGQCRVRFPGFPAQGVDVVMGDLNSLAPGDLHGLDGQLQE